MISLHAHENMAETSWQFVFVNAPLFFIVEQVKQTLQGKITTLRFNDGVFFIFKQQEILLETRNEIAENHPAELIDWIYNVRTKEGQEYGTSILFSEVGNIVVVSLERYFNRKSYPVSIITTEKQVPYFILNYSKSEHSNVRPSFMSLILISR